MHSRFVLGEDPLQQRAIKRLLWMALPSALVYALVGIGASKGLSPPGVSWLVIGYASAGLCVFYGLLRNSRAARTSDQDLAFAQLLFTSSVAVLAYALLPYARGAVLQALFVAFVFDLQRLSARRITQAAVTTAGMLVLTVVGLWALDPAAVQPQQEALNLAMSALFVPVLSIVGRRVRGIQERQNQERLELDQVLSRLDHLSKRDALTDAVNRRHITTLLHDETARQNRTRRPYSVAMVDIDFFKRINDTHGHAVGDRVLRQLTRMAVEALHKTAVVGRWGGEEFLLLMPETSGPKAFAAMQAFRRRIDRRDWSDCAQGLRVTFSCGVREHPTGESAMQTVEQADLALYRAKQRGRNRVEMA